MTRNIPPEELGDLVQAFSRNSHRHHHKIIRELAQLALALGMQNLLLQAKVDGLEQQRRLEPVPFVAACDQDVA